ncbi:MAG: feruloyl-CoA synthase [Thermodesulfobacteriota bacterium]
MRPPTAFAPARVEVEHRLGGGMRLRSPEPLGAYPACVGAYLEHWARETPEAVFLAERQGRAWRRLTYREALGQVRAAAQALLDRRLDPGRPVAILSENSLRHAVLGLACMHVGIPVSPVSPAYSLVSRDYGKLRHVLGLLEPQLLFVEATEPFARALAAAAPAGAEAEVVAGEPGAGATAFAELLGTAPSAAVDEAYRAVGPDTVAKVLFTSGSTGEPKGVINTQRMLCSNQQAMAQCWPFLEKRPPVMLDWLPWNHTFGGNKVFHLILRNGGALYLDAGKPTPGHIETTAANLRETSPTVYFNVPRGYAALLPYLEEDPALRDSLFRDLDVLFYAGAALPQNLWERLEALSVASVGRTVAMSSGWGSTETGPVVTLVHYPVGRAGVIGLPVPGAELAMVPNGDKLELRVRGPGVTPGYWKRDDLTREAFDREGFYRIGDAGALADPARPEAGIRFDGRVAEDFKLTSGTWVSVGRLRTDVIAACAPFVQDAVVTGHDRDEIGLLLFPDLEACRRACPSLAPGAPVEELLSREEVVAGIRAGLGRLARESGGSASRPARALFLTTPARLDAGEITDKGYVNQRAVLAHRAELVARLHGDVGGAGPEVILL